MRDFFSDTAKHENIRSCSVMLFSLAFFSDMGSLTENRTHVFSHGYVRLKGLVCYRHHVYKIRGPIKHGSCHSKWSFFEVSGYQEKKHTTVEYLSYAYKLSNSYIFEGNDN